jgi:hypothetical protein
MISTYGINQGLIVNGNLNIKDFTYQAYVTGYVEIIKSINFIYNYVFILIKQNKY